MTRITFNQWLALIGLSLLSFTAFLDYTIVATALPFIQKELNASVLQLQWVMNIMTIILCMFMIITGLAGDIFGRRNIFYFGFVLFGLAAIGAGLSTSIQWLIFFRGLQGFSAAIIFTLGVALLPQTLPADRQTTAIGIFSAFNGAGLAMGPFLGGLLITYFSWRWVFWINIPIIMVGFMCCVFTLKAPPPLTEHKKIRIDWLGLVLLIVGLGCFVFGLIHGQQVGWQHNVTIINLLIGIAALIALFIVETRVSEPLLDLNIFKNHLALLAILVCISAGIITSVFLFFDPLFLHIIYQENAFNIGLTLLIIPLVQIIISLLLGRLVSAFGIAQILFVALLTGVLAACLHALFKADSSFYLILLALILMGYTWGIANAGSITAVYSSIPQEKTGIAMGTIFTFWNISGSISLALATIVFQWRAEILQNLQHDASQPINIQASMINDPVAFLSGFHWVSLLAATFMLVIMFIPIIYRKEKNK